MCTKWHLFCIACQLKFSFVTLLFVGWMGWGGDDCLLLLKRPSAKSGCCLEKGAAHHDYKAVPAIFFMEIWKRININQRLKEAKEHNQCEKCKGTWAHFFSISGYNARGRELLWTPKIFHLPITITNAWDPLWEIESLSDLMFGSDCACQHFLRCTSSCLLSPIPNSGHYQ